MATAEFEIGTSLVSMTNIEELTTPLPVPRTVFYPYADYVTTGTGLKRGIGRARTKWIFARLTTAQRDQLREFCDGPSDTVYIRTATNEDEDSYADFSAIMHWVEEEDRRAGYRFDVEILYTELIEQEES